MGTELDTHCHLLGRLGSWPARLSPRGSSSNLPSPDEQSRIERGMVALDDVVALSAPSSPQHRSYARRLTDKRRSRRGSWPRSFAAVPTMRTPTLDGTRKMRRAAPPSAFSCRSSDPPTPNSSAASLSRRRLLPDGDHGSGGGGGSSTGACGGGGSGTYNNNVCGGTEAEHSLKKEKAVNGDLPRAYPFTGVLMPSGGSDGAGGAKTPNSQQQQQLAPAEFAFRPHTPLPSPPKRPRALHDVDGPGTGALPCKKRRLRLHLITSRLSLPYSLPATHILSRGPSGEDGSSGTGGGSMAPSLSRLLRKLHAVNTAVKRAGHQTALVRKAAILNRVRINVRQAAVQRGHVQMAGLAARQNALNHGLLVVTAPDYAAATGARFPGHAAVAAAAGYHHYLADGIPNAWKPHTTAVPPTTSSVTATPVPTTLPHAPLPSNPPYPLPFATGLDKKASEASQIRPPPAPRLGPRPDPEPVPVTTPALTSDSFPQRSLVKPQPQPQPSWNLQPTDPPTPPRANSSMINAPVPGDSGGGGVVYQDEDEDDMGGAFAFPAPDLDTRYAELSDDDMDDVYADFGVLFGGGGGGSASESTGGDTSGGGGGSNSDSRGDEDRDHNRVGEEHFYEEYLDELDGIPWIT